MCGIFGVIAKKNSYYSDKLLKNTITDLALLSESRGKDSSGIAFRNEDSNTINVFKGTVAISRLMSHGLIRKELHNNLNGSLTSNLNHTFAVIGHARLVTNGSQLENVNNQPVVKDGIVGIHNGIIVNVDELWSKNSDLVRQYEIDTEVMFSLFRKYKNQGLSSTCSISKSINNINGPSLSLFSSSQCAAALQDCAQKKSSLLLRSFVLRTYWMIRSRK